MKGETVFWAAGALLAAIYVGYPAVMAVLGRAAHRPVPDSVTPAVTVVIAAHNEESVIDGKLQSILEQTYPSELLDIVLVSDGSTDATVARARSAAGSRIRVVELERPVGKAAALNAAMAEAQGSIVVLTDARQHLDAHAVERLVARFSDAGVGAVSGDLRYDRATEVGMQRALHRYWDYEKRIRLGESRVHSIAGATGALYAIRRSLWNDLPPGTLLDDVYTPMQIVLGGYRVIFEPDAWAWDRASPGDEHEYRRRVRTLTGNYQLLALLPGLLSPLKNPIWIQYGLHKLGRLASPLLLVAVLAGAALASGPFYQAAFVVQAAFWVFVMIIALTRASVRFAWPVALPYAFAMTQAAAVLAFVHFTRRNWDVWGR